MGINRGEHKDRSPSEVCRRMKLSVGLDKKELYRVWLAYNRRLKTCSNPRVAVEKLQTHPEIYPESYLNYFTALGFQLFNKEYLEEVKDDSGFVPRGCDGSGEEELGGE